MIHDNSQFSRNRSGYALANVFNNAQGQLRTGWRIAFLFLLFLLSTMLVGVVFAVVIGITHAKADSVNNVVNLFQEFCEIGSVFFMVYLIEKDTLRNFGFPASRRIGRDILYGFLWAAVSMTFIFWVFTSSGNAVLQNPLGRPHGSPDLLLMLVLFILVGFGEEMMTRGYAMTLLLRQTGKPWKAIGVSALIFAALHLLNPHVSVLAIVNLVLYGIVAGMMYLRSGSLWLPIAYHATWDLFEGNVYGFPDSGTVTPSLYTFAHVKANLLTGGGFGPEGGYLVTLVLLAALLWIWKIYQPVQPVDPELKAVR